MMSFFIGTIKIFYFYLEPQVESRNRRNMETGKYIFWVLSLKVLIEHKIPFRPKTYIGNKLKIRGLVFFLCLELEIGPKPQYSK